MLRPAFRSARLVFGRHEGAFTFPGVARPVVIRGPNGSGKSTLVEGMIRTLFGYEKRRSAEAAHMVARRPWEAGAMAGEVTLEIRGEVVRVRRDFTTDRVRVDAPAEGLVHFEGDGNPGATNQEARHYRRILVDLFGIADLDTYHCTLYIRQGDLPGTTVGDHLLRLAAGGHARVDGARRDIAEAHRGVTRRPIHAAARAAINPRELEKVDEEIATVRARLKAARQAGERRGPITLERDRTAERLAALDEDIRLLEDAQSALARAGAIEMELRQLREWGRKLDRAADRLGRATEAATAADDALREVVRDGRYPDDLPERLVAADLRWRDLEALEEGPVRWPAIAGLAALTAALVLGSAGQTPFAAGAAGVGGLLVVAWLALQLDVRRRHRSASAEITALLNGVPGPRSLSPAARRQHERAFRAQERAQARRARARADLADVARDARALLRELRASGLADELPRNGEKPEAPRRQLPRVADLRGRMEAAASSARDRLASTRLALEHLGDLSLRLPDGVPPIQADVTTALKERRRERARVQNAVQELGQQLLERGTPAESIAALEETLADLVPRRDALDRKARALEAAHALVADAYDAFRSSDEDRLLAHVSRHAHALSGGAAGPLVVSGTLENSAVRMAGRTLPLESPPLSFGELHALLLAVRLGAADFLGGVGILPPLVVDEPFAHLDERRAMAVWEILQAVAGERQVLVTTQDALLLDHLGIEADLSLPG